MYNVQTSFFVLTENAIMNSRVLSSYCEMFKELDFSGIPDRKHKYGKKGYSVYAMVRALIVKNREHIESIPRLIDFLDGNPIMAELCGFPYGKLPHSSQFYRFLKHTRNEMFENLLYPINSKLIQSGEITMDTFIIDSKPVLAATNDNNPKNSGRNLTKKEKIPKRNPEAALAVFAKNPNGSLMFFWGYRTHVIVTKEGIVLVELTLKNNITDADVAMMLIKKLKKIYNFKKGVLFIADAAYDMNKLYELIINSLKCQAFIPINPRNAKEPHPLGLNGRPLCDAGLEMTADGQWFEKSRNTIKHKYKCPLKNSQAINQYPDGCPVCNPKFNGYGCTKYKSEPNSARASVPRESAEYKQKYAQRICVEQYFARMGHLEAYQTSHYSLNTVKNQMTIAHLTMNLVALAAISIEKKEKMRCYRTFANIA